MSSKIRVVQYGMGPIGRGIAQLVLEKEDLALVGAIDIAPHLQGRDLGELLDRGGDVGLQVSGDAQATLARARPDLVLHATVSSLERAVPQIRQAIESGADVISTCEELAYPFYRHPRLSEELDQLARQHEVTVLGTGVNPGFVMDKLVFTLMAACRRVERVRVRREVNAALRREPLQRKVGAGLRRDQFDALVAEGKICHVGLPESAAMIAHVLGLEPTDITETIDAVIADQDITTPFLTVKKGDVAGVEQVARVMVGGEEKIILELRMYVGAKAAADEIHIQGEPEIHMTIPGGIHGDVATAAIVVNAIPAVLNAKPGLITMIDVPIAYWGP
ncbi:MAG: dihydrodipicolinate reductase [Anaerolineae bacterium]